MALALFDASRGRLFAASILLAALCGTVAPSNAGSPGMTGGQVSEARLVSAVREVAPSTPFWIGLRIDLPAGWHTYWSNPGDSGVPSQVDVRLPAGFAAEPPSWPRPARITEGPIVVYGYKDLAWALIRVTPPEVLATTNRPH